MIQTTCSNNTLNMGYEKDRPLLYPSIEDLSLPESPKTTNSNIPNPFDNSHQALCNQHDPHHQNEVPYYIPKDAEIKNSLPSYVIHKLNRKDTLTTLALQYGVLKEHIKQFNGILSPDLDVYEKDEIAIPNPRQLPTRVIEEKVDSEQERKRIAISVFQTVQSTISSQVDLRLVDESFS